MKRDISVRNDLFGFHTTPFTGAPAEPFSDERRTRYQCKAGAFMHRRGFAFVTGGPGCGKTLLVNELCASQNSRTTKVMYVPFAMFGDTDMLREICGQIGIEPAYRMGTMIRNIQERTREMQPVNPILVIDEVQLIGQETLDMLRILSNFKFESANLFTVIMAGDESFRHRLQLRINEPLRQRITLFITLGPLSRQDATAYIQHQTRIAGAHQKIFDEQAANLIFDITGGIPRLINNLASAALEEASLDQEPEVALRHVEQASATCMPPSKEAPRDDTQAL
jgi:type II secretory pathway predicted ATPase ExeA